MAVQVRTGQYFWDPASGPGSIHRAGTTLVVANTDASGADLSPLLAQLLPGDVVHIDHVDDPDGWWSYTVAEAPTPGNPEPAPVGTHLLVDNYSGGFIRVRPAPDAPGSVDFTLATSPGPGGAVYATLGDIPGGAAVWADFAGNLGRLKMADGAGVYGSDLKEWIRRGTVYSVHKDVTDPAHPNLIVGDEVAPPPAADMTVIKITSGGHGPTADPKNGDNMVVTFMQMVGHPEPPPAIPTLIDPARLTEHLGLSGGPDMRALEALAAAEAWACRRRSMTEPAVLFSRPDAAQGTVIFAGLLYLSRSQPQGFPGLDAELGTYSEDAAMAMSQAMRLVGQDVVVA